MKNFYSILVLALLHLSYPGIAQEGYKTAFEGIYKEVSANSEAYERLRYSTEKLGHRLTGSANGKNAEKYAYKLLKSYGLDVSYQPFSSESWSRISLQLKLNNKDIPSVSLAHSPIQVDLKADLIDAENGLEEDFQKLGNAVKGKVALVYLHILPNSPAGLKNLHRSEKTAIASKYGASGILFINSVKDNVLLTGTASITGKLIDIPAICVGLEEGMSWKETLKKEAVKVDIKMRNASKIAKSRNIIVRIKGSELPNEKIVIGGHLDSWDLATGAIDNGLGSFAIMDMARTFKKLNLKSKRSIDFVLFMGEEQGLLGSKAYVDQALKSGTIEQIKYMLNFDMVNAPTGFSSSRPEMKTLLDAWGAIYSEVDTDFKNNYSINAGLHSDHQPFMLQGLPVGTATGGPLPNNSGLYYHSDKDHFNLVDKNGMEQTVRVGCAYLYSLANVNSLPVSRLDDKKLVEFLESNGLKQPLKISGEWRWGN